MSEQPRLLFCCFDVLPGPNGLSRRITEYLKGLIDRFQVVVLSTKTPDHSHIERYHGARLLRVPVGSGDLQSRIQAFDRAVRRQLESEEYVIAHFFDPFGGYPLCEARAQYGFRLVYDAQSFQSQELRYREPALESDRRFLSKVRRQELYCLMNADAVICGSGTTRDWILSLGAPPMSLHVFPQPVDLAPYKKEVVGEPDGTPMKLIHLGSQLPYQGLDTLLRAMQLALRQADLRLMVVGPKVPDGQAPYDELVQELRLTGKVEFLPPVVHDELPKTLATADVGVLTLDECDRNRAQGGPLAKVAEYLAAGRPIVAADLPVTRELVPESARVLFPPNDFKALADILVKLASDTALRLKLGRAAREGAERFDASTVRGKLLDLYGLLSTRGKVGANEGPGEVTELRQTGSTDTGRALVRPGPDERSPGETLDEEASEPPVVVGESLETPERPEERLRAAITEPGHASPSAPPEPTPITNSKRRKKKGGTDEHTPIRPPPEASSEPTPITSARQRRVISKTGAPAVAPPPAPLPEPLTPLKAKTEGKGVRSPLAASPTVSLEQPAVTVENPLPAPAPEAPVCIKPKTEGKGVRSPFAPQPSPSVIVELDARPPGPLVTTPSKGSDAVKPGAAPLAEPPPFDLPKIKRSVPESKPAQIPVLMPKPATPAVSPPAQIPVLLAKPAPVAVSPPAPPAAPRPAPDVTQPLTGQSIDEPMELGPDDVESVEDEAHPAAAAIDPWLSQLLFGYCPPDALPFERPAPPTTFPGRDT